MMRPLALLGLFVGASAQVDHLSGRQLDFREFFDTCAQPVQDGPTSGAGTGNVVPCHDETGDGSCAIYVQRANGDMLSDGDEYSPGEELTVAVMRACQLDPSAPCGDGFQVIIDIDGVTWPSGSGTTGCGDSRLLNPFMNPTITAPMDGSPLVINAGTGYCRGTANEATGEITSACADAWHVADAVTLSAGTGAPSCPGDVDGVTIPGDGVFGPPDRQFFYINVDDLLMLLANFGNYCEDPRSVPPPPPTSGTGGDAILIGGGPTGPVERVVNGELNGPVVDNTIPGFNTHNCEVSIVDWDGRSGVLKNADAGGFSDIYQTINTVAGETYALEFDVWATPIHNTAGNAYCTSTDSNGLVAIAEGAVQMGCGIPGGYCAHGETRLCPEVDGGWTTVSGSYTATTGASTFRLHGESGYDAYFDRISLIGPAPTANIIVNGALNGPVVDNTIAGWNTHNCEVSIVDWEGRSGVLKNADAGGFSDIYQSAMTTAGMSYQVMYDVWATPIHNTAGNAYCTSTDSNGLLAIVEGAVQMGCGMPDGYCDHGEMRICPEVDAGWTTVTGTYTANTDMTTFRLHGESGYDAYFDSISVAPIMGPPSTCEAVVNGALNGPVVDNTIAGWNTHNCEVSIVDWEGRSGVLKNADAGGFSDIYQSINTVPGGRYEISFDVWATPIHNTAGNAYCTSTDSNGLMAIAEGAVQMGCGMPDGYCAHGETRLCPSVDGGWTTVSGSYTATGLASTFRLHGESGYDAYFDTVSVSGPCVAGQGNVVVNGDLDGPVVDNTIAGWSTHNCEVSIVDWEGETGVLKNKDAGGFSDIYQSINTIPGTVYDVEFKVWATPIHNTAGNAYCTSTDSNGLLAIVEGAVQMGCGMPDGYCGHGEYRLCPEVDGGWTTVSGSYTAMTPMTTFRLHGESGYDAYFDYLSITTVGAPPAICERAVNAALDGPVVDNTIAGWSTHNCEVSIVDWEGETGVLKNADAGGFSDIYQSINTIPGEGYSIAYTVWATPIHNTAGNAYCTSTDSNGLMAIAEGAVTMGCGMPDGYCAHGEARICPSIDGGWETVTGVFTATSTAATFRLHGESGYDAYFKEVSVQGPCPSGNIIVNGDLSGPVVDNTIAGFNTHNCEVSIVDWEGRTGVLKNKDAGGFSDIYQSAPTMVGVTYDVSFDVWATPIHNTAGNAYCTSTDSNGLLAIVVGAVQMGCGLPDGYCDHGEYRLCPEVDGGWTTVTGTYTASSDMTTFRMHGESGYDAYFDNLSVVAQGGSVAAPASCEMVVNSDLNGPVVDNTIAGWNTHNCEVSIVDWEGRSGVLKNKDAGGFSDIYQSIVTTPGAAFDISFDVWATPIHNTAGNAYCTSTDSNGLLAIAEGAVQMGCGMPDGYCAHGEMRLCPEVDGGWTTVTGTYTATTPMTTFRLHGESGYDAYFDSISIVGPCPSGNIVVNPELDGPVVDNTIAGYNTHNCAVSIVDWNGRTGVLKNADAGGFSDIYQSLNTVVGQIYNVAYDVWATPIHNTAGNAYCTSTDSNGLMAITEGAVQMGCGMPGGYCGHGEMRICPSTDGGWETVTGTYTATTPMTTFRLHGESGYDAYFDRVEWV